MTRWFLSTLEENIIGKEVLNIIYINLTPFDDGNGLNPISLISEMD